MELFHFDIETCGEYVDFDSFRLNDKRGSDLFESKYGKMGWDVKYNSLNEAYVDNAGIISTYGRICCISFGFTDNDGNKKINSYSGTDEKYIVESFNNLIKRIELKTFSLSGFRINYFDLPWILHKLHKYDIKPANMIYLYDKKPWDCRIVDMSDDWKSKFAWAFSFDEVCYELGIQSPKDNMNGSEVHKYYWSGRIEEIKTYCEKDVSSSIDVSLKLYK
jgi:predicted PolB exonuclease-like 3'-5' exonuclease